MSILDDIARRRRASALRRLGPPPGALPEHFPAPAQRQPLAPVAPRQPIQAPQPIQVVTSEPPPETPERPIVVPAPVLATINWQMDRPLVSEPESVAVLEPEPVVETLVEPEPEPEPEPETEPEPEPEALVEPEPEPVVEPEPIVESEPEPEPDALAEPTPRIEPVPAPSLPPRRVPAFTPPAAASLRYESWLPAPDLFKLIAEPVTSTELEPVTATHAAVVTSTQLVTVPQPGTDGRLQKLLKLPGFLVRAQLRRRIRYLRHLKEIQLRDLGGFALELHRVGRERPELVRSKLESAAETDRELRQLELVLNGRVELREVREQGIGGVCDNCGAVHGSEDRFCANCGGPLPGTRLHADGGPSQ